jgi:hypothetical protein
MSTNKNCTAADNSAQTKMLFSLIGLIPGFTQGITRVMISYPFDAVKVKMQKDPTSSMTSIIKKYIKQDAGLFYRGVSVPLFTVSLERAVSYSMFEKLNKKLNPYVSGFCSSVLFSPLNVPMQYLTTNIVHNETRSVGAYLRKEITSTNIFRGYLPEISKNIIASTVYLGTYGNLRNNLPKEKKYFMLSGICASFATWSVIFPLDTIRTEYQTSVNSNLLGDKISHKDASRSEIINYKQLITKRVHAHGIRSFWNGITPVFIRSIPSSSIGMLVYEIVKKHTEKLSDFSDKKSP